MTTLPLPNSNTYGFLPMLYWHIKPPKNAPIYDWLLENKEAILHDAAVYDGETITDKTILRQYHGVVSAGIATLCFKSPHLITSAHDRRGLATNLQYSLLTLVCGWWCIPWGPLFTIWALWVNLRGGEKRTAASLLQQLQWGWDAPSNVAVGEFKRDLVDLTPAAVAEIEARKAARRFPDGIAVRVTPTRYADDEVEIAFDYPVSDGRFWIDESNEITLIIDKKHESELADRRIDFVDGIFLAKMGRTAIGSAN